MIPSRSSFARVEAPASLPEEEPRGGANTEHLRAAEEAEAAVRREAERRARREMEEVEGRRAITRADLRSIHALEHRTHLVRADTTVTRANGLLSLALWFALGAGATYFASRTAS